MNGSGSYRQGVKTSDSLAGKAFGSEGLSSSAIGGGMFSFNSNPASLKGKI